MEEKNFSFYTHNAVGIRRSGTILQMQWCRFLSVIQTWCDGTNTVVVLATLIAFECVAYDAQRRQADGNQNKTIDCHFAI